MTGRFLATLAVLVCASCASDARSARVSTISIAPREATLAPGAQLAFSAVLTGDVEGARPLFDLFDEHGDPCETCGTIDAATGAFKAPARAMTVVVRARSSADANLCAKARVVVAPPTPPAHSPAGG